MIECVTGGINALKATAEEKEEIKRNFRCALQVESLEEVVVTDLMNVLENDSISERFKYRLEASANSKKGFVKVTKGKRLQEEKGIAD